MWWGMTSLRKGNIHKPSFQPRSLPVENWAMRLPEVMIGYFGVAYPGQRTYGRTGRDSSSS